MARQKDFDVNDVVKKATEVFWHQGFDATSMTDLTDAMGIYRKSLYDTFGDKHQLYMKCLAQYEMQAFERLQAVYNNEHSLLSRAKKIFDEAISNGTKGCLLINTATELAQSDEEIRAFLTENFMKQEQFFIKIIDEAKENQELSNLTDSKVLADFIINAWAGLRVLVKFNTDEQMLQAIVKQNLELLK